MNEGLAFVLQGEADRAVGELIATNLNEPSCHAIAKWQQAVEKCMKGIVAALRDAKVLHQDPGFDHKVADLTEVLIRLPRASDNRMIHRHLMGMFDPATKAALRSLDALVPRRPPKGRPPVRNTEYPFRSDRNDWLHPASAGVFSKEEEARFRAVAHRDAAGAGKIVSAILRSPR